MLSLRVSSTRKVNNLENEKFVLEEKLRTQKECHMVKLERLRQSHKQIFKMFQEDPQKNLFEALPKWRSNLILHTQVAVGPLDLKKVDFKYIPTNSLNFDIYQLVGNFPEGRLYIQRSNFRGHPSF